MVATSSLSNFTMTSPGLDAALGRRAVGRDGGDERAGVLRHAQRAGDLVGHGLDLHAEPAAAHLVELPQLLARPAATVSAGTAEADADGAAGR